MVTIEEKKSSKRKFDLRLDDTARADITDAAKLTGTDASAIIHKAIQWYKTSPELKADIEKHQRELAEAGERLTAQKVSKADTEHTILDAVDQKVSRGKRPRSRSK